MAQGKKISTPTITVKSATTGQNVTVATTGKYAETVVIDNELVADPREVNPGVVT